jgi:hypothetical protein
MIDPRVLPRSELVRCGTDRAPMAAPSPITDNRVQGTVIAVAMDDLCHQVLRCSGDQKAAGRARHRPPHRRPSGPQPSDMAVEIEISMIADVGD